MSRRTLKDSSGLTSRSSWKPREIMLRDSISRASISSVMAFQVISHTVSLACIDEGNGYSNLLSVTSGEQPHPQATAPPLPRRSLHACAPKTYLSLVMSGMSAQSQSCSHHELACSLHILMKVAANPWYRSSSPDVLCPHQFLCPLLVQ